MCYTLIENCEKFTEMLQRYVYRHSKRISQRADTTAEEERLIVNPTIFAVSQNLFSKIMSKYFILKVHIQHLLLAFILLSLLI